MSRFVLRNWSENAATVLVELNYVSVFFYAIKDNCNRDGQITYLFALGDLLDVDDSGKKSLVGC